MTEVPIKGPTRGPNCWDCKYLAITWDARMPYGCRLMGFRSRVFPSLEVLRTDGRFCSGFCAKSVNDRVNSTPKPLQPVDVTSPRQKIDPRKTFHYINLIT